MYESSSDKIPFWHFLRDCWSGLTIVQGSPQWHEGVERVLGFVPPSIRVIMKSQRQKIAFLIFLFFVIMSFKKCYFEPAVGYVFLPLALQPTLFLISNTFIHFISYIETFLVSSESHSTVEWEFINKLMVVDESLTYMSTSKPTWSLPPTITLHLILIGAPTACKIFHIITFSVKQA